MNDTETRLRAALRDLADEVASAPLLERLQHNHRSGARRRRLALVVVAAATVAAVAAGSLVVLRMDQPRFIEPVKRPPKVFRLADTSSASPGRVDLAITLAPVRQADDKPAYLLPAAGTAGVRLPGSDAVSWAWTQQLSPDGTRFIRQENASADPFLEIVDLRSGRSDDLGGTKGFCPALSPDNRLVAYYSDGARLLDVRSRSSSLLQRVNVGTEFPCAGGLGWSPDGNRLAIRHRDKTVVVDRSGATFLRLPGVALTNGTMSWSPDGRLILVYRTASGSYLVQPSDGGSAWTLAPPAGAINPIGWVGRRIAWLAGPAGDQSLITTDQAGTDAQTWMRFDIGDRSVEAVQWARDLSGFISE